jgi:hypothetical protein
MLLSPLEVELLLLTPELQLPSLLFSLLLLLLTVWGRVLGLERTQPSLPP